VFTRLGLDAKPETDREWRMNCPFHSDRTPSFYVNVPDQVYHCFGCGASGGFAELLMDMGRLDFLSAVVLMARMGPTNGTAPPLEPQVPITLSPETLRTFHPAWSHPYLQRRHLVPETAAAFDVRWHAELNRLVIPVYTEHRALTGFVFREIDDTIKPKYKYSHDLRKSLILFNLDRVVKNRWPGVIITEGVFDVMALYEVDVPCAVATFGGALSDSQVVLLQRAGITQALLAFDVDPDGQGQGFTAITRVKCQAAHIATKEVKLPPRTKDVAECSPIVRRRLFVQEVSPWLRKL
jgi:DNA primase